MATSSKRPTGEKRKEKVDWATTPAFEVQDIKLSDHSYLDADNLNAFSIGIFTGRMIKIKCGQSLLNLRRSEECTTTQASPRASKTCACITISGCGHVEWM